MDSAPHRRDPASVLLPDFDASDRETSHVQTHDVAVTHDPGEAAWSGDSWLGNHLAETAWLDAAGPGESGRRTVAPGADGGCVGLWRAVIWQAFLDATAFGNEEIPAWARPKVGEPARRGARAWLLGGSKNFDEVCQLAQIDPTAVRARARDLERQDWEMNLAERRAGLDDAI